MNVNAQPSLPTNADKAIHTQASIIDVSRNFLTTILEKICTVVKKIFVYIRLNLEALLNRFRNHVYTDGGSERFTVTPIVKTWKNAFISTTTTSQNSARSDYQETVLYWRQSAPLRVDAKNEAYALFRNQEVVKSFRHEVFSELAKYHDQDLQTINSVQELEKAYGSILHKTPGPTGNPAGCFDPLLFGNIPFNWHTLTLDGNKTCQLIRMPAVTCDSYSSEGALQANISEEFVQYTKSLKEKKERHLYVNLMCLNQNNEKIRSEALVQFGKQNPQEIIMVSMDKNSPFYTQSNAKKEQRTDEFIAELLATFLVLSLYSWPSDLEKADLEKIQKQAIAQASIQYPNTKLLSRKERTQIIDHVHTNIIDGLLNHYKPSATNLSCKNCIDRGIAQEAELVARKTVERGENYFNSTFNAVVLGSAYLVASRAMQKDRFARLISYLNSLR